MMKIIFFFIGFLSIHVSGLSQADSTILQGDCFCKSDGMNRLIVKIKQDPGYEKKLPYYAFKIREYRNRILQAQFDILLDSYKRNDQRMMDSIKNRALFFLRVDIEIASSLPPKEVEKMLEELEKEEITYLRILENTIYFKNPLEDLETTLKKYRNG